MTSKNGGRGSAKSETLRKLTCQKILVMAYKLRYTPAEAVDFLCELGFSHDEIDDAAAILYVGEA